jgi:hypothetical protein
MGGVRVEGRFWLGRSGPKISILRQSGVEFWLCSVSRRRVRVTGHAPHRSAGGDPNQKGNPLLPHLTLSTRGYELHRRFVSRVPPRFYDRVGVPRPPVFDHVHV